jgi:hypothetical protein
MERRIRCYGACEAARTEPRDVDLSWRSILLRLFAALTHQP